MRLLILSILFCLVPISICRWEDDSWKPDDMRDGETLTQYFERRNREMEERIARRKYKCVNVH